MQSRHPAARPESLPQWVETGLAEDPAYHVLTMDGGGWIDPFTGSVVPVVTELVVAARDHLRRSGSWRSGSPLALRELLRLRWLHYLSASLDFIPSLRLIRHGQWLNPYTGRWHPAPADDVQRAPLRYAEHLAGVLVDCPEAQSGRMLERWQLDGLIAHGPTPTGPSRDTLAPLAMPAPTQRPAAARAPGPLRVEATPLRSATVAEATPLRSTSVADPTPMRTAALAGGRMRTDFVAVREGFLQMLRRPPRLERHQIVLQFAPHAPIPRDFYDVVALKDGRIVVAMGSVTGAGPGTALLAGTTLESLRTLAPRHRDLVGLTCAINDVVRADLVHGSAIAFAAVALDPAGTHLEVLAAGHPPILLASPRRDEVLRQLRSSGASLGSLVGGDFRDSLTPEGCDLEAGDILVLPGRGLAHAADPADPDAGRWKIAGSVVANLKKPVTELVSAVMEASRVGVPDLRDDLMLLAIRVKDESWLLEGKMR